MASDPPGKHRKGLLFAVNWLNTIAAAGIMAMLGVIFAALYSAFIFSGPLLDYMVPSVRVFLWGTALVMIVTVAFSGIRGVYASIQDEAVVILAVVAAAILQELGGQADSAVFATILGAVAASTLVTGLVFYLLGAFRLGRIIRYVPFSVTAGFMITIGWLLIVGGFQVAEGKQIHLIFLDSFEQGTLAWKASAALIFAACLQLFANRYGKVIALPVSFAAGSAIFLAGSFMLDISSAELARSGWLLPIDSRDASINALWTGLGEVEWRIIFIHWRDYISIAVISALALLLAVTGLELTTRARVDVDRELRAAGIANMGGGLAGGVTGYPDVSVTTMLRQRSSTSRLAVLLAALACVAVALMDVKWLGLVPLPFLGGVFLWLGWQLWEEWLFKHGDYLQSKDWIAVGAIVFVTVTAGFIAGVLLGIGVGVALFLIDYSQVRAIRYVVNGREIRSNVDRPPAMEQYLYEQGRRIHIIKLQGYLFFARSHQVLVQLEPYFERMKRAQRHFVLVDFKGVAGIDSTATMGFVRLLQMAREAGGELVFTGLSAEARVDLSKNELSDVLLHYFDTLDQGLAYCEDQILEDRAELRAERVTAEDIFAGILDVSADTLLAGQYLSREEVAAGDVLIEVGDPADDIFIVESGSLSVKTVGIEHKAITLRGLEPGSVFGEMAFYLGGSRTASVVADTDSVVNRLSGDSLRRMELESPQLAMAVHKLLARLMATKLRQTNTWLGHLT